MGFFFWGSENRIIYPTEAAMRKVIAGRRLDMALVTEADVRYMPSKNKFWLIVTLLADTEKKHCQRVPNTKKNNYPR